MISTKELGYTVICYTDMIFGFICSFDDRAFSYQGKLV